MTTTADHDDGVCGGADCTLREAINRANFLGGAHTITFASGVTGTITLSGNAFDELSVTSNLTISGPDATKTAPKHRGSPEKSFYYFSASALFGSRLSRFDHVKIVIVGSNSGPLCPSAPGDINLQS